MRRCFCSAGEQRRDSTSEVNMSTLYVLLVTAVSLSVSDCLTHHPARNVSHLNQAVALHSHRLHRRQAQPLTAAQVSEIVDMHNALRASEGAADMQLMTWNGYLASLAATWAAGCRFVHGQPPHDLTPKPGQNLYATSGQSVSLKGAIQQAWYGNEKVQYDYDANKCSGICGHYTAIVWATSYEVGCAIHACKPPSKMGSATFMVCNYYPPGNWGTRPYTKGPACSKCSGGAGWCNKDGLCNRECSKPGKNCSCAMICYNCATLDTNTCRCKCADGWHGDDCKVRCEDKHKFCGANPGWPDASRCKDTDYVRERCLVMCNLCTPDENAVADKCEPNYGPTADRSYVYISVGPNASPSTLMTAVMLAMNIIVLTISNKSAL